MNRNANRFALIAPYQNETLNLWQRLDTQFPKQGSWLQSLSAVQAQLGSLSQTRSSPPLIINIPRMDRSQLERVRLIRRNLPSSPLMIVSSQWQEGVRFELIKEKDVFPIETPLEIRNLTSLILSWLDNSPRTQMPARAFARIPRAESVALSIANAPDFVGRFIDYSRMGSQILTLKNNLQLGQTLELTYESSAPGNHRHRMAARICWLQSHFQFVEVVTRVGLKFIAHY